jgi:lipoprotein-anchoring transpeptidase ErfK/SrfK
MSERHVRISLEAQRLDLLEDDDVVKSYPVSTSKHGAGEQTDSYQTPRGRHIIRAKIGASEPEGAVFKGRRPTGEIYSDELARTRPDRDWVLTRILWLSGTEVGVNRLGAVDSMRRHIYIHGTPPTEPLGVARSVGCIRMSNADIVKLFDLVAPGTVVEIQA